MTFEGGGGGEGGGREVGGGVQKNFCSTLRQKKHFKLNKL